MKAVSRLGVPMSLRMPTIYDVAVLAGVSAATVSRVLNEPSKVHSEKRKNVQEAINALKFIPKADAVAHARRQYKKIGVIAPFFTQPSFMQRLRGISTVLSGHHYELVMYAIESKKELEEYVDMLAFNSRVDGLIVLCLNIKNEGIAALMDAALPVCFVESDVSGFDSVIVDNYKGGWMAGAFLYGQGFTVPGFIGEFSHQDFAIPAADLRLKGYSDFFAQKGIQVKTENICLGPFPEENSNSGMQKILSRKDRPDCIFASSDMIAIRLMRIALQKGIAIPKELGLIGFDDLDIAEYLNLSTVSQSLDESGRLAAEMVLDRINDPSREIRKVTVMQKVMNRVIAV